MNGARGTDGLFAAVLKDLNDTSKKQEKVDVSLNQLKLNKYSAFDLWHQGAAHADREIIKKMKVGNVYEMRNDDKPEMDDMNASKEKQGACDRGIFHEIANMKFQAVICNYYKTGLAHGSIYFLMIITAS